MQRVNGHKQYQKCVTFRLVSVEDLLERVAEAEEEVYGYADGDSDNSSMDGADIDWVFLFILGFYFCLSMVKLNYGRVAFINKYFVVTENDIFILASIL